MKIRTMELADLTSVAKLLNAYRVFYQKEFDHEGCYTFLKARFEANQSVVFVAEVSSEIVGFTQLYPIFSTVSLQRAYLLNDLFVVPEARKTGAGASLIQATFSYAQENGASYVTLETGVDNTTAQRLYQRMGMAVDNGVYHFTKSYS
ncbi:Ribosomal protein S18 acetylase RimI [Amphibacillus marinus]|uniref:Ribosomal protein S18 acetylase RimI n=1 Tax=Amphibacillus marinus TaxID=872970 RepID=A0A1H8TGP6_9BACI|nr:GNAT family N-acetyltransferase [Amphibacillus marinus]SEO89985.1 Ribosomal protein S18 acetylase RimI [Amphibacillus marinus]